MVTIITIVDDDSLSKNHSFRRTSRWLQWFNLLVRFTQGMDRTGGCCFLFLVVVMKWIIPSFPTWNAPARKIWQSIVISHFFDIPFLSPFLIPMFLIFSRKVSTWGICRKYFWSKVVENSSPGFKDDAWLNDESIWINQLIHGFSVGKHHRCNGCWVYDRYDLQLIGL